jgi:hypothetical protein
VSFSGKPRLRLSARRRMILSSVARIVSIGVIPGKRTVASEVLSSGQLTGIYTAHEA